MTTETGSPLTTRLEVEDFLYHEAALLDEWRLDDWVSLFADDARYVVPATDALDGTPEDSLVLVTDDVFRLRARVRRLNSRRAHREFPWSRTRRMISNVRVIEDRGEELEVVANFVIYRIRRDMNTYVGRYRYVLRRSHGSFLIRSRRAELDLEALRPHGTASIIL
jgi:p-cumate 2,3-dioxygenase beta subunit